MSYNPTIELDLAATTLTLANDNLHWSYVRVSVVVDEETLEETRTAEFVANEQHIDPLQYWESDGQIYYKIGHLTPVVDGKRTAHFIWENTKKPVQLALSDIPYDIDFEFTDFTLGTAKTYVLDLKAKKAYTILGIVLETDTGTFIGVSVKIGSTAVTSLSSITASTIAETAASGANSVALGDRVTINLSTGYTGTPTTIRGKLLRQLT